MHPNHTKQTEGGKWRHRLASLRKRLQQAPTQDDVDGVGPTVATLQTSLAHFAKRQFDFFHDGFDLAWNADRAAELPAGYRLEPSAAFPSEYVLRTIVDQIAFDTDLFQRVHAQRHDALSTDETRASLQRGDRLAYDALQLTVDLPEPTTVLTYFQKAANVRIIPYAPVALVGVPYTVLDTPQDYLAIPHEVGHYIYRYGMIRNGAARAAPLRTLLSERLAGQPAWLQNWLEEIVADVYGCLVAGPVMALSFQELLTDNPRAAFARDDGDHPVAAVRASIYTDTLRRMGFDKVAQKLDARWAEWRKRRGDPQNFMPYDPAGAAQPVPLETARRHLTAAVDIICDYLLPCYAAKRGEGSSVWRDTLAHSPNSSADLPDILDEFTAKVVTIEPEPVPPLQHDEQDLWVDIDGSTQRRALGSVNPWHDFIRRTATEGTLADAASPISIPVWIDILNADGWTTEGPEGQGGDK